MSTRFLLCRMCLAAYLMFAIQGTCCGVQNESETASSNVQPERISLSRYTESVSESYVCIEPCNLLTQYTPTKTIFFDRAPDSVGSYGAVVSARTTFLIQDTKTTPLGNADLSKKAMGESTRKCPSWIWKGLLITLGCTIAGYIISSLLPHKNTIGFSPLQLTIVLVPLVPFLLLLLAFGLMSIAPYSPPKPLVSIYVDNATPSAYVVRLNGEDIPLPSKTHICLSVRRREHDLRIRKKSDGKALRFSVTPDFNAQETYLINLEGANSYKVAHHYYDNY